MIYFNIYFKKLKIKWHQEQRQTFIKGSTNIIFQIFPSSLFMHVMFSSHICERTFNKDKLDSSLFCTYLQNRYILHTQYQVHKPTTPSKNNLFRTSNASANGLSHENGCVKSSSQLQGEHCKCSSDFFPSECLGLCLTQTGAFTREKVG